MKMPVVCILFWGSGEESNSLNCPISRGDISYTPLPHSSKPGKEHLFISSVVISSSSPQYPSCSLFHSPYPEIFVCLFVFKELCDLNRHTQIIQDNVSISMSSTKLYIISLSFFLHER